MSEYKVVLGPDVPLVTRENVREVLKDHPELDAIERELQPGGYFDPPPPVIFVVPPKGSLT